MLRWQTLPDTVIIRRPKDFCLRQGPATVRPVLRRRMPFVGTTVQDLATGRDHKSICHPFPSFNSIEVSHLLARNPGLFPGAGMEPGSSVEAGWEIHVHFTGSTGARRALSTRTAGPGFPGKAVSAAMGINHF